MATESEYREGGDYMKHFMFFSQLSTDIKFALKDKEKLVNEKKHLQEDYETLKHSSLNEKHEMAKKMKDLRSENDHFKEALQHMQQEQANSDLELAKVNKKYKYLNTVHSELCNEMEKLRLELADSALQMRTPLEPDAEESLPLVSHNSLFDMLNNRCQQLSREVRETQEFQAELSKKQNSVLEKERYMQRYFKEVESKVSLLESNYATQSNELKDLRESLKLTKSENVSWRMKHDQLVVELNAAKLCAEALEKKTAVYEEMLLSCRSQKKNTIDSLQNTMALCETQMKESKKEEEKSRKLVVDAQYTVARLQSHIELRDEEIKQLKNEKRREIEKMVSENSPRNSKDLLFDSSEIETACTAVLCEIVNILSSSESDV